MVSFLLVWSLNEMTMAFFLFLGAYISVGAKNSGTRMDRCIKNALPFIFRDLNYAPSGQAGFSPSFFLACPQSPLTCLVPLPYFLVPTLAGNRDAPTSRTIIAVFRTRNSPVFELLPWYVLMCVGWQVTLQLEMDF